MPFYREIGFAYALLYVFVFMCFLKGSVTEKYIKNWTISTKNPAEMSCHFLCVQVLFCYEQFDELTLLHLREFDKKKLISVETDIVVDHYKEEKFEDSKPGPLLSRIHSS